jgi:hypothetical protein
MKRAARRLFHRRPEIFLACLFFATDWQYVGPLTWTRLRERSTHDDKGRYSELPLAAALNDMSSSIRQRR